MAGVAWPVAGRVLADSFGTLAVPDQGQLVSEKAFRSGRSVSEHSLRLGPLVSEKSLHLSFWFLAGDFGKVLTRVLSG